AARLRDHPAAPGGQAQFPQKNSGAGPDTRAQRNPLGRGAPPRAALFIPQAVRKRASNHSKLSSRLMEPPKIALACSSLGPVRLKASICASNTLASHPRGKNDESVPKSNRSLPTKSIARLKTVGRSTGAASYFIHLFVLEVST